MLYILLLLGSLLFGLILLATGANLVVQSEKHDSRDSSRGDWPGIYTASIRGSIVCDHHTNTRLKPEQPILILLKDEK